MATRLVLCPTAEAVAPWAGAIAALARAEAARPGAWLHDNEAAFYGRFHGAHGATAVVAEQGGALVRFALVGFAAGAGVGLRCGRSRGSELDRARCGSLVQAASTRRFAAAASGSGWWGCGSRRRARGGW
ncbi:MAG: hypothetical protein R3F65_30725 [bacterium]